MSTTLFNQLKPFINDASFQQEFQSITTVTQWFSGHIHPSYLALSVWRPSLYAANIIGAPLRGSPHIDAGVDAVSAQLRTQIVTLTSLVAECPFCAAFNCGVRPPKPLPLLPAALPPRARAALAAVAAATALPAANSPRMRAGVARAFGERGVRRIAGLCGFMALWNTVNELLTTDVDADMLEYASVVLEGTGWNLDKRQTSVSANPQSQTQSAKKPNRGSFLNAASHALKISKTHSKLMKQFPTSNKRLDSWIVENFGFQPRYLTCMASLESKRSLCFHLKISLFTGLDTTSQEFPGTPYKLTVTEKIVIGFLFVNSIPNTYLAAHFAKLAWDRKIPSADLLKAQRNSKLSVEEAQTFTELVHILTPRIALRDSSHYDISPLLLPASQNNPDIVLEVVTVLGTFALLHRYTAFWDDDCGLEPEVKKLMDEEYAKDLGLAGSDFSANCSDGSKPRNVTGFSNFSAQPKEPKIWGGGIKYD